MRVKDVNAFFRRRLSREGFLGLHLTLSILVLIGATWAFWAIAEDIITGDRITIVDARISAWLHIHGTPALTKFMLLVSDVHETAPVLIATAAFCVYLWARRLRIWILIFTITVGGGTLLNVLLKHIFHRSRPYFENPIVVLTTYSFPSGHTIMATVFYGTLCAFVLSQTRRRHWRILAIVVAVLMIALVGFSRMYLGAHYLTDVAGAMLEGLVWVGLTLTAVSVMRQRRGNR